MNVQFCTKHISTESYMYVCSFVYGNVFLEKKAVFKGYKSHVLSAWKFIKILRYTLN